MFNPLDFLNISYELQKQYSGDERVIRICIGRAYYSAYLYAREWLINRQNETFPSSADAHREVHDKLGQYCGAGVKIKINTLRINLRNKADYDLTTVLTEREVKKANILANEIIAVCK